MELLELVLQHAMVGYSLKDELDFLVVIKGKVIRIHIYINT